MPVSLLSLTSTSTLQPSATATTASTLLPLPPHRPPTFHDPQLLLFILFFSSSIIFHLIRRLAPRFSRSAVLSMRAELYARRHLHPASKQQLAAKIKQDVLGVLHALTREGVVTPFAERDEVVARMVAERVRARMREEERAVVVWNLVGITEWFEEVVGRELCEVVSWPWLGLWREGEEEAGREVRARSGGRAGDDTVHQMDLGSGEVDSGGESVVGSEAEDERSEAGN